MTVSTPIQSTYYYECSNGAFRLYYFIPPSELNRLIRENKISSNVLNDFPDGVDLGSTEKDFRVFEKLYKYRPKIEPETMRNAFFAIFSSTHNWKKFRGSGLIPAEVLEKQIEEINAVLQKTDTEFEDVKYHGKKLSNKDYRKSRRKQIARKNKTINLLQKFQAVGINPQATMNQQEFSPINMTQGDDAEKVFNKLLLKQQKDI